MRKTAERIFNGMVNVPDIRIDYKGYTIQPKLDMGSTPWRIGPNEIRKGYVITKDGVSIMPGATWSTTVCGAKNMIDAHIYSTGDSEVFFKLLDYANGKNEWEEV